MVLLFCAYPVFNSMNGSCLSGRCLYEHNVTQVIMSVTWLFHGKAQHYHVAKQTDTAFSSKGAEMSEMAMAIPPLTFGLWETAAGA